MNPNRHGNIWRMSCRKQSVRVCRLSTLAIGALALCFATFGGAVENEDPARADVSEPKPPADNQANQSRPAVAEIVVQFKLDPSLTAGIQMGERWVSPAIYASARQAGKQGAVEARAIGVDDKGRLLDKRLEAEWLPADPDMLTVSPSRGNTVKITIQRLGQSSLRVISGKISKVLTIKAIYEERYDTTQVQISQEAPLATHALFPDKS